MSLFISFEGGDGSGKSTQAKILADRLKQSGISVVLVHEPGTTELGEYLRDWLKRDSSASHRSHAAELFLFAAARAELVAKVVKPELKAGKIVIADRYKDSTTVYQGFGRGIKLKYISVINELATDNITPNLTFLLDCPPEKSLARVGLARMQFDREGPKHLESMRPIEEGTTRFEKESLAFHKRIREGYLKLASAEPERWHVIDSTKTVDEISAEIWGRVHRLLKDKTLKPSAPPKASLL